MPGVFNIVHKHSISIFKIIYAWENQQSFIQLDVSIINISMSNFTVIITFSRLHDTVNTVSSCGKIYAFRQANVLANWFNDNFPFMQCVEFYFQSRRCVYCICLKSLEGYLVLKTLILIMCKWKVFCLKANILLANNSLIQSRFCIKLLTVWKAC